MISTVPEAPAGRGEGTLTTPRTNFPGSKMLEPMDQGPRVTGEEPMFFTVSTTLKSSPTTVEPKSTVLFSAITVVPCLTWS